MSDTPNQSDEQQLIITPELLEMSADYITELRAHTNLGDTTKDVLPGQLRYAAQQLRTRRIHIV